MWLNDTGFRGARMAPCWLATPGALVWQKPRGESGHGINKQRIRRFKEL